MRVPPFQSCTCASARRSATSGSRWRRQRVMLVSRVPKVSTCTCGCRCASAVHVVQEQARIAVHRAGDVEQHDQRRQLDARLREGRRQRLRRARHAQQRRAQVEAAARRRLVAAAAHRRDRQRRSARASFFACSNSAVVIASKSACCSRSRSLKVKLGVELQLVARRLRRGFGGAGGAAARAPPAGGSARGAPRASPRPLTLGSSRQHQLLEQLRVAPEGGERGVEEGLLLVAVEHHGRQRGMHVVAPRRGRPPRRRPSPAARGRGRRSGRRRAARGRNGRCSRRSCVEASHSRPSRSQRSRRAATRRAASPCRRSASARCRPGTSAARPACRAPSAGSRRTALSATSALVQSIVSATPGALNRSSVRMRCTNSTTCTYSRSAAPGAFSRTISSSRSSDGKSTQWYRQRRFSASWISRVRLRRDDRDRRRARADRAELGHGDLVLGQHLEQEGVERLVGAVELVDQQDRRARLRQRLQQRPLDQHVARVQALHELASRSRVVRRLGEPDLDHLPRDVPFVGGLRDVEPFVALHAQQRACPAPARAPCRARSCRRPARLRGTAGAASFRLRNSAVARRRSQT